MKTLTVTQMAQAADTTTDIIRQIMIKENINPVLRKPIRLNEYEQNIVFKIIYYEYRQQFITLPSKMNDPDFDSPEVYDRNNCCISNN